MGISKRKSTLKPKGSSHVAIGNIVGNAVYTANNADPMHRHSKEIYNKNPCTAVYRRIILAVNEVYLYVKSNTRGVQMVTSHKYPVRNHHVQAARGMIDVAPARSFNTKMEDYLS